MNSTAALWNLATNTKKVFPKPGIKGLLWNVDGTIVRRINHNSAILASDISSDNLIVTGDENGVVKIWDSKSKTGEVSFQAHKLAINSICFAPDGKSFITASNDKTVLSMESKWTFD
ncbi:MAG: hypothetical protein IPO85_08675 [Saprospiraceae bacterium]|uniref:Anaphase-promoting complex subunit 4 WD40 domain-containing protein n=1 Tax=Candidatus Defluviibacterium haderslevense TaxID=2981993 RepID=A0A9D7S7W2_9BACT|nr:hypothetical protein [Candidatus Defluviibacterium haderslevense]